MPSLGTVYQERRTLLGSVARFCLLLPLGVGWLALRRASRLPTRPRVLEVSLPLEGKTVHLGAAALTEEADRYRAVSTRCSHLGCRVRLQDGELACPCHGSRFDLAGRVLRGPAKESLRPISVRLDPGEGRLTLELPT